MNDVQQFEQELNGQSRAIESMLPPGLELRRFMRTVSNTLQTHPQSPRLMAADRQSLFSACQKAAGDGLLLDGREATLVVFHESKTDTDKINYMPMVQGLVKLARNSSEISRIVAEVVYDQDGFTYRPGFEEQPLHEPDWFGERGRPIGAYAVVTTKENEKLVSVLPRDRIMAIGQGGRNADQYIPGKGVHFVEWWKKTVIKNVLKYAPKSTYLASAMAADNELIDPDAIPTTEKDATPLKAALAQHGESLTVRTESKQPPARRVNNRPHGEKLTGTENTPENTHKDHTEGVDDPTRTEGIRKILHEQKQVPITEPNEQDRKTLQMAIDSIASCDSIEQLEECGGDLEGKLHPEFVKEARTAYKRRMAELKQSEEEKQEEPPKKTRGRKTEC